MFCSPEGTLHSPKLGVGGYLRLKAEPPPPPPPPPEGLVERAPKLGVLMLPDRPIPAGGGIKRPAPAPAEVGGGKGAAPIEEGGKGAPIEEGGGGIGGCDEAAAAAAEEGGPTPIGVGAPISGGGRGVVGGGGCCWWW